MSLKEPADLTTPSKSLRDSRPASALRDSQTTAAPVMVGDLQVPAAEIPAPDLLGGDRAIVPVAKEPAGKGAGSIPKPADQKKSDLDSLLPLLDKPALDAPSVKSQEKPAVPLDKPLDAPMAIASDTSLSQATVEKAENGDPVLVVRVGWKDVSRASLQVALAVDPKADLAKLAPISLDGARAQSLWEEQVAAINKPLFPNARDVRKTSTVFMEYNGAQWLRVRSRENSLGRPAAYAVQDKEGTLLVLYLLDRWADDQGAIRIALADLDVATKFAQPGQLKIWLLGDGKVVTSVVAAWPGKPGAGVVGQPAEAVKPGEARPSQPQAKPEKSSSPAVTASDTKKTPPPPASPAVKPVAKPAASKPAQATTGPATTGPAKPPTAVNAPPAVPATAKPSSVVPPATSSVAAGGQAALPPGKQDIQDMSINDLTSYIERTYADQMSQSVRKSWLGGMRNYYHSENPEVVRRDVFMALLRSCWKEQRPGEMRNAFATLYLKLKYPAEGTDKK